MEQISNFIVQSQRSEKKEKKILFYNRPAEVFVAVFLKAADG
jgi:hypothetical protein